MQNLQEMNGLKEQIIKFESKLDKQLTENQVIIGRLWNHFENGYESLKEKIELWIETNQALQLAIKDIAQVLLSQTKEMGRSSEYILKLIQVLVKSEAQLTTSEASLKKLEEQAYTSQKLMIELSNKLTSLYEIQLKESEKHEKQKPEITTKKSNENLIKSFLNKHLISITLGNTMLLLAILGVTLIKPQEQIVKAKVNEREISLTLQDIDKLYWARSQEGEFARNLIRWNSDKLTNLDCTKDVDRLGVTLNVSGRPATYGFCTIWVVPPNQRRFSQ